jgi:YaiO family outer membrane protein
MMRKYLKKAVYIGILLLFVGQMIPAADSTIQEKALQALKSEDFQTVINICQSQLESDPDNYEFNFILSRAYAYSRQWEKALSLLDRLLEIYPQNLDLLLFRSRIHAWKGAYVEADSGFNEVLSLEPENKEAMIGRAEIASWKKEFADAREKYEKILQLNPDDPDIHFRIGRVFLWDGNYSEARYHYGKACELDPENVVYQRALKGAHHEFVNNYELRYQYQNMGFSDNRSNYIDNQLIFSVKISPDIGSLHLKYNQTQRYGEQDSQFGIELYPHLWQKAYGYIDLNFSPEAVHYPRTSYLFEVYQSFSRGAEISLGYRRMNFEDKAVSVYLGSIGYYVGNFYPYLRWYYTPEDEGNSFSWLVNVRRYFTKDSYLALGYGQGSRYFDIITIEDVFAGKSWIFLAEWDWYFFEKIRLKIQFTHQTEKDRPTRNAMLVSTGYRW